MVGIWVWARLKLRLELGKMKSLHPRHKLFLAYYYFLPISLAFDFMKRGIAYFFLSKYDQKTVSEIALSWPL